MQNITVSKAKLLQQLQDNRASHRALFLQAQEVFREKVIQTLDQRLAQARSGGRIELFINLPEPVDYTDEFDRAIAMMEWEESDQITLSEKDFQRYVLNKWEWAAAFAANTQSYLVQ
jgi:hypothetical protein